MVLNLKFTGLCFIFLCIYTIQGFGIKKDYKLELCDVGLLIDSRPNNDQTSPRANTLSDDQDDIQRQLDNEARDRIQYATPKTIWVLHFPIHKTQHHGKKRAFHVILTSKPHNVETDQNENNLEPQSEDFVEKVHEDLNGCCVYLAKIGPQSSEALFKKVKRKVTLTTGRIPLPTNRYQSNPRLTRTEQISRLRASQSPIAISLQKCPTWTSLDALKFRGYWDNDGCGILLNTGQTAYFTLDTNSRPRLSGGPLIGEYIFEQMHFHWSVDDFTGCEHVLDGHGYAAECHFVHYNSKYESMEAAVGHADGLAVVGFLLEAVDAPNPRFDKLVEGLEGIQKRDQTVQVTAESLGWMERDDLSEGSYVTYKGSLTTPPYTECVTWIIYKTPVQIGTEQLGLLRQLEGLDGKPIERNVRPTQRHPPGHSVIYVKQIKAKL